MKFAINLKLDNDTIPETITPIEIRDRLSTAVAEVVTGLDNRRDLVGAEFVVRRVHRRRKRAKK